MVSDKLSQQIKMTHKLPLLEQLEHFREQLDQTHENFDLTGEVSPSPLSQKVNLDTLLGIDY